LVSILRDEGRSERDDGEDLEDGDDEALMAEVAAGNRAAFDVLTRRHLRKSLSLACRIVHGRHDAEEVVQDAFLQVWRHANHWRGDRARFTTWLHRIVVNRSLDYWRRRRFAPLEDAADILTPLPDAQAIVEERQLASRVDAAISALPDRQRVALSLCYYEELSAAEAAGVLKMSVSAMESLLVRARCTLREKLQPLLGPVDAGEDRS
jgi:RNA polymerase sigma-70 factor (ECF subfamily)